MGLASKRQKHREIANEVDKISRLPDHVLCHILAFLPTKYAVRTAVLSRRWRHTWTSVDVLHFEDTVFPHKETVACRNSFASFVHSVLILRSRSCIKRFRLSLLNPYSTSDLDTWIWAAIIHNVEELDLSINQKGTYELPQILFSCGSITMLKIQRGMHLKLSESICLRSLKVLHLSDVEHLGVVAIQRLLFGCPVIEELVIRYFDDVEMTMKVQSSSLKIFKIVGVYRSSERCGIFVDAPRLEVLEVNNLGIVIRNPSSIVEATFDFTQYSQTTPDSYADKTIQLLCQICNVEVLSLSSNIFKHLFYKSNRHFPLFHNLAHLVVTSYKNQWWNLLEMLGASPNLKVLILNKSYPGAILSEALNEEQVVPQCVMTSLERFKFVSFEGSAEDMVIVEYILRNAKVLKEIRIETCYLFGFFENEPELALLNKLSILPRESNKCEIIVSRY